jgi:MFS family permease
VCSFIIGNVLSGFAQNAIWLFACRGLSGIGAGGIISLSMICVADLVPVRERGKYQGYTGFMVALGSGMGPLIGAVMAARISWRWAFCECYSTSTMRVLYDVHCTVQVLYLWMVIEGSHRR